MPKLKKGDRVTVKVDRRPAFNGTITGEGRSGHWWIILKDGKRCATSYHKNFCKPEVAGVRGSSPQGAPSKLAGKRKRSDTPQRDCAVPHWVEGPSLPNGER